MHPTSPKLFAQQMPFMGEAARSVTSMELILMKSLAEGAVTLADKLDLLGVKEKISALLKKGKELATMAVLLEKCSDTWPIAETLIKALSSSHLQYQVEIKYTLARAARLFVDLNFIRIKKQNESLYAETKDRLLENLQKVCNALKPSDVGLRHEIEYMIVIIKLIESTENYWTDYAIALAKVIFDGEVGKGLEEIKKLCSKLNGAWQWIGQVHYISLIGSQYLSSKHIDSLKNLQEYVCTSSQEPNIGIAAVNVFTDLINHGDLLIQTQAFFGNNLNHQTGLLDLAISTSKKWTSSLWSVRYLAVQKLCLLAEHKNTRIATKSHEELLDRSIHETNKTVRALLQKVCNENASVKKELKKLFEINETKYWEEVRQEEKDLVDEKNQLTDFKKRLENEHKRIDDEYKQLQECKDSQLAIREKAEQELQLRINKVKQAETLFQQRNQVHEEIKEYNDIKKENLSNLHSSLIKGFNIILDEIFDSAKDDTDSPIPETPYEFLGPISLEIMKDPVVAADGFTYEREKIEIWLKEHNTSPKTLLPLEHKFLTPNINLRQTIEEWKRTNGRSLSPRISENLKISKDPLPSLLVVPKRVLRPSAPSTGSLPTVKILQESDLKRRQSSPESMKQEIYRRRASARDAIHLERPINFAQEILKEERCSEFSPFQGRHSSENLLHDNMGQNILDLSIDPTISSDKIMDRLRENPSVTSINFKGCSHVDDSTLLALKKNCAHIEELNLEDCFQVTDLGLKILVETFPKIQDLNLAGCTKISGKHISSFKEVTKLNLNKCISIKEENIKSIAINCIKLQELYIEDCITVPNLTIILLAKTNPHLHTLHLTTCKGISLESLMGFKSFASLAIRDCGIINKANIEKFASHFTSLERLDLGECDLNDSSLFHLGSYFGNLKELSISSKYITDKGIHNLVVGCDKLEKIELRKAYEITDGTLFHLRRLPNLDSLAIWSCQKVTDKSFAEILQIKNLTSLALVDTSMTDTALLAIDQLPYLTSLNLSRNRAVTNDVLSKITTNLIYLKSLDINTCVNITGSGLKYIKKLKDLKSLNLNRCNLIDDSGILNLTENSNLEFLDIGMCKQITAAGVSKLHSLKKLKSLKMSGCSQVREIPQLSRFVSLTDIDLSGCSQVTNDTLKGLADVPMLRSINLSLCSQITSDGLAEFANMNELETLDLSYCHQITDVNLEKLAYSNNLKSINFEHCSRVTDQGLKKVCKNPHIVSLYLLECSVSDIGLEEIGKLAGLTSLSLSLSDRTTGNGLKNLTNLNYLTKVTLNKCGKINQNGLVELGKLTRKVPIIKTDI